MATSQDKTPVQRCLDKRRNNATSAFEADDCDGLIAIYLKSFFGKRIWRVLFDWLVPILANRCQESLCPDAIVRRAIDCYMFLWTGVLTCVYVGGFVLFINVASNQTVYLWSLGICLCTPPLYRLLEILSVFVQLHLKNSYKSPAPVRAVTDALWIYFDIAISFAIFYMVIAAVRMDNFGDDSASYLAPGRGLLEHLIDPVYFSFVTIATLGYGDFAPESTVGKGLVIAEVYFGLLLIVIVVQRTIASGSQARHPRNKRRFIVPRHEL